MIGKHAKDEMRVCHCDFKILWKNLENGLGPILIIGPMGLVKCFGVVVCPTIHNSIFNAHRVIFC